MRSPHSINCIGKTEYTVHETVLCSIQWQVHRMIHQWCHMTCNDVTWSTNDVTWPTSGVTWSTNDVTWSTNDVTWFTNGVTWSTNDVTWSWMMLLSYLSHNFANPFSCSMRRLWEQFPSDYHWAFYYTGHTLWLRLHHALWGICFLPRQNSANDWARE